MELLRNCGGPEISKIPKKKKIPDSYINEEIRGEGTGKAMKGITSEKASMAEGRPEDPLEGMERSKADL